MLLVTFAGKKLDMTDNRMDMIEMDVPVGQVDKCTLNMLKVWRDEENGKSEQLYNALMVRKLSS